MDIFGKDDAAQRKLIELYNSKELLFSPLHNSTLTAKGTLSNVEFNEQDFDHFDCTETVLTVDSNFTHSKYELYDESLRKKSNRGRKKKVKKNKTRKIQGTGDCMNSQIQFGIIGQLVRKIPDYPDKHSKVIVINPEEILETLPESDVQELNENSVEEVTDEIPNEEPVKYTIEQLAVKVLPRVEIPEGHELVIKKYIFLVFRNGRFTLPGVLTEDLSDVINPIRSLCEFLSLEFWAEPGKVKLLDIDPTMRNYKFQLLDRRIDLLKLQKFCSDHFHTLLNIHFKHVRQFLVDEVKTISGSKSTIDYNFLKQYLKDAPPPKNLYVNFEKLKLHLSKFDIPSHYAKISDLVDLVYYHFSIDINDELKKYIWSSYIGSFLHVLENKLTKDDDNKLSHIKFNPELYPGFIVKIKTPVVGNKDKRTTIKLFKSGKIDIDGANNRQEAEFIYLWLNALFADNKELTYNPDKPLDEDEDDEYSFSAEDD